MAFNSPPPFVEEELLLPEVVPFNSDGMWVVVVKVNGTMRLHPCFECHIVMRKLTMRMCAKPHCSDDQAITSDSTCSSLQH